MYKQDKSNESFGVGLINLFHKQFSKDNLGKEYLERKIKASIEYQKFHTYSSVRCGNIECTAEYVNYDKLFDCDFIEYFESEDKRRKDVNTNKWYICKGCKTVRYCSRRCQKISWNRCDHRRQCGEIQKNYKDYF